MSSKERKDQPEGRRKELGDGRRCIRTIEHEVAAIGSEGISFEFCLAHCGVCGSRQCGQVLPHPGRHICGQCDRV